MKSGRRSLAVCLATAALAAAGLAIAAGAGQQAAGDAIGVWYGQTFLGDPSDPTTPTIPFALTLHADGTALLTAADETGKHPAFPGEFTAAHGAWDRQGGAVSFRLFQFADEVDPSGGFSILRIVGTGSFNGLDGMIGTAGFDTLPCPGGATKCPSPSSAPLPPGDALVFTLERFN